MSKLGFGKTGAFTGKKAISLIFLVMGVMLMLFIVSQGSGIYRSSREDSDRKIPSAQCVGFIYTIAGITAAGDELQFDFMNGMSSAEDVHNLTVVDEGGKKQTFQLSIPIGTSAAVSVPVSAFENFTVYPDDCGVFPARCSLKGGCSYR